MSYRPPIRKRSGSLDDGEKETSGAMSYDEKLAAQYFGNSTPSHGFLLLTPDDPRTPAFTFRTVFLGVVWGVFYGCVDTLFSFRTNDFALPPALLKILVLPCGHFLARVLPKGVLNPSKFTVKEHVLITIIAGAAGGVPHGIDNVIMQKSDMFLNDPRINFINSLCWVAVTQLIGLGIAGFLVRFLVKPVSLYWPHKISCCALFTTLHDVDTDGKDSKKYSMGRLTFFWIVGIIFFFYHWIPTFLVTSIGSIALLCLVTTNRTARFLGSAGSNAGVGLGALTLDFTVGHGDYPYVQPWWATVNWVVAKVGWEYLLTPLLYYTNFWNGPRMMSSYFYPDGKPFGIQNSLKIFNASGYPVRIGRPHNFLVVSHNGTIVQALNATTEPLPLSVSNTSSIATNTSVVSSIMQLVANTTIAAGNAVNATNPTNSFSTLHRRALPKDPYHGFNDILNHKFELDINKFKAHQPFFITELHAIYNFARFISITASISYIYLWYGKDIGGWISNAINGRSTDNGSTDVHNRLMKAYTEVPEKVWAVWLLVFSAVTIIVCTVTPFYLPIWASLLAICVGIVGTFLNGFLKAISGARISNALVAEILIGYIYPGNIIVCAAFQSLTRNIEIQAVELLGDLKLGHYLHIPPVAMVTCQIMGVCIGAVVNTVTAFYVMDVMKEPKIFSDPAWLGVVYERFVNTAGIWGAIGPQRFFGPQTPYSTLYYGFALGIVVPFIPYIFNKMFPHHWWHLINPALLFSSMQVGHLQAGALYHLIIGFIFQFYIFRFKKEWFDKYMYIFAAALSFGAGICLFASIVLLAFRPDLKPAASFLNPGNVDWYCFDGSPKSSSKGGINH